MSALTFRLTISTDDVTSVSIWNLATGSRPSDLPSLTERFRVLAAHPGAAAIAFQRMQQAVIKFILGWDEKTNQPLRYPCGDSQKTLNDARDIGGMLGVTRAFVIANETQARGSLHMHICVWTAGHYNLLERAKQLFSDINRKAGNAVTDSKAGSMDVRCMPSVRGALLPDSKSADVIKPSQSVPLLSASPSLHSRVTPILARPDQQPVPPWSLVDPGIPGSDVNMFQSRLSSDTDMDVCDIDMSDRKSDSVVASVVCSSRSHSNDPSISGLPLLPVVARSFARCTVNEPNSASRDTGRVASNATALIPVVSSNTSSNSACAGLSSLLQSVITCEFYLSDSQLTDANSCPSCYVQLKLQSDAVLTILRYVTIWSSIDL